MDSGIRTKFLIMSDTHGEDFPAELQPQASVDVAIHCGDLTEESKLSEFKSTLGLLNRINAPLKLVIAGNHDFSFDTPAFKAILAESYPPLDHESVIREFGDFEEARSLLVTAKDSGIILLDEGTHEFILKNGAKLKVYASPYTPFKSKMGFQYRPEVDHDWSIDTTIDIVVTHGPPNGILDRTSSKQRAGSPSLFRAIFHARPRLHCFGHIHEGWGAKFVTWRNNVKEELSHFTAIDNEKSALIESLTGITPGKYDDVEVVEAKERKQADYRRERVCATSHCSEDDRPVKKGHNTLFVNAAIQGWARTYFICLGLSNLNLNELSSTRSI